MSRTPRPKSPVTPAGAWTRRRLLRTGTAAAGLASLGVGLSRLARGDALAQSVAPGDLDKYREPEVRRSVDGVLATTLDAQPVAELGPNKMGYEGTIPGPTLRVAPGDVLRIDLVNNLGGPMTNLHLHGMHVSPEGNGDNVFVTVEPGESFAYEYAIPTNHRGGLNWYHPHHHGDAGAQVGAGLAGALVVEGPIDRLPGIAEAPERILIVQGPSAADGSLRFTVNGVVNPEIAIRPGETQRWRILNASANNPVNLLLDGYPFHLIATDGNPLPEPRTVDGPLLIAPAERYELLVQGGPPGFAALRSLPWGELGQAQPEIPIATVVSVGEPVAPRPLPTALLPLDRDLREVEPDRQRIVTFEEDFSSPPFFAIDGAGFDPDVVNVTAKLGTVEEWVVRNTSPEWHPFHIHVMDVQVISIDGVPQPPAYKDTVNLPPQGEVVLRIPFVDFPGKFVFHCHLLAHEDFGMMAVIEVVP